jgi:hypothetical protein
VERAGPIWGKPEAGHAADKSLNTPLFSALTQLLACHGVAPGAYRSIADAALVTADKLAALGDTLFSPRLPAPDSACGRVMAEAVARPQWEAGGVLAQTPPPKHRPGTFYKVAEDVVPLYGKPERAVVVYSSQQEQRRQKRVEREVQAASTTRAPTVRAAAKPEYCCRADAEAAAEQLRALQSAYHRVEVGRAERPQYGPGRPSQQQPRVVKALRYGLQGTLHERAEGVARKRQEAGCFVLLPHVPTAGERAHRAGEVLRAYQEPHGVEQTFAFFKAPVMVNRLLLKKPERSEALGRVLWLALRLWRLVERTLRVHVETTGNLVMGGDKQATQKPTAFMMMTKFAAVMVRKVAGQRQLAQPLSAVPQAYLKALGVPLTYLTLPPSG